MGAQLTNVTLSSLTMTVSSVLGAQVTSRADTTQMRVVWEVAEGIHPTADSLGRLTGVAVDRNGTVCVSDGSDARIWVFSQLDVRSSARERKTVHGTGSKRSLCVHAAPQVMLPTTYAHTAEIDR